jgi:PIN domain nuclease of toxin-antitoxin system
VGGRSFSSDIETSVEIGLQPLRVSDFASYVELEGFELLSISADHAVRAGLLPGPHKDAFDHMLIAQAQAESMPLVSNDTIFDVYAVRRIW